MEVNRIIIFRWKEAHEEIHVDVKCSAEEIEVTLKGVIPHEIFQLKDPSCRLSPAGRYTQSIQVKKLTHVKFCLATPYQPSFWVSETPCGQKILKA